MKYDKIFIHSPANLPPSGRYVVKKRNGEVFWDYEYDSESDISRDKWLTMVEWFMLEVKN